RDDAGAPNRRHAHGRPGPGRRQGHRRAHPRSCVRRDHRRRAAAQAHLRGDQALLRGLQGARAQGSQGRAGVGPRARSRSRARGARALSRRREQAARLALSYARAVSSATLTTIGLLIVSNVFMTFAWYGHLKHLERSPLWIAIAVSWGIALFEYCFQVPANRTGHLAGMPTAQLKTIQEVITLVVFAAFAVFWLGEPLKWNHAVGFVFVAVGAAFVFKPW